ncbi:hypothetical protein TSPI_02560 [Trichinella spiralis]
MTHKNFALIKNCTLTAYLHYHPRIIIAHVACFTFVYQLCLSSVLPCMRFLKDLAKWLLWKRKSSCLELFLNARKR